MSSEEIASSRARIERLIRIRNTIVVWRQMLTRQYDDERDHSEYQQARPGTIAQGNEILARLRECDSFLDSAIIEYSQACARPLGKGMQVLPRELRDMIYEKLLHRVESRCFRLTLDKNKWIAEQSKWKQSPKTDLAVFPWIEAPPYGDQCQAGPLHYEDPKYFGTAFVLELTEMYFRRTTFVCDQTRSWSSVATFPPLGRFLKHDPFKTGHNIHLRIRKLELNLLEQAWDLGPDVFDRRSLVDDKSTSAAERLNKMELEASFRSSRLSDLRSSLSIIRNECAINIKFTVRPNHDEGLMGWRVMCTALMPIVEMLENNGCTVSFQVNIWRVGFYKGSVEFPWYDKFWDMETTSQPFHAYLVDMLKKFPVTDVASEKSTMQAFSGLFTDRLRRHRMSRAARLAEGLADSD